MSTSTVNDYPIHELLQVRWSPRAYDPTRTVSREQLLSLFEAARWAPSSNNGQPWRFILATRDNPEAYDKLLNVIVEGNQKWAKDAPVLVLNITKNVDYKGRPSKNARHDLGQAVAHLTIQAAAMGLMLRQMGGIEADKAREVYGIPEDYDVLNAMAIGYPSDEAVQTMKPRTRHPLASFVFDEWEQPAAILEMPETEQA